jgi:hypothetical protein
MNLQPAGIVFIHDIQEQPWGQRVMRLYDPDGNVLEIGETMESTAWRLYQQGLSIEGVREKPACPRNSLNRRSGSAVGQLSRLFRNEPDARAFCCEQARPRNCQM